MFCIIFIFSIDIEFTPWSNRRIKEIHVLTDSQVASLADGGLKIKNNIPLASTIAKKLTELPKLADGQVDSLADDSLKIKNKMFVALTANKSPRAS